MEYDSVTIGITSKNLHKKKTLFKFLSSYNSSSRLGFTLRASLWSLLPALHAVPVAFPTTANHMSACTARNAFK